MMQYKIKATDLIRKRSSWRSYSEQPVETEKKESLDAFFEGLETPFWGNKSRFMLVDVGPPGKGRMKGTYGMIKGAGTFIAGAVKRGPRDMEDYGYLFEKIILFATDLDLGTCWMGLTFARGPLAERIRLSPKETIPAVSPLGYAASRRTLSDTVARAGAGSSKRKPWRQLFFDSDWNTELSKNAAGPYEVPLEMVRLGPSATNKQPWRIIRRDDAYHFFLQRSPGLKKLTSSADMQRLDMGIAMCHFELTAREQGLDGSWDEKEPKISLPNKCEYVVSWVG